MVTLTRVSRSLYTYKSNISKRCVLGTKLLKNTNRKPYTIYRMITLSMTLSDLHPDFKVTTFFDIEYLRNDARARYSHTYCRTSIGSHMRSIARWHFQWPRRTPNPVFKVMAILKANIGRQSYYCSRGNYIYSNIWNDSMFGDLDWPLSALRGIVSIS